MAASATDKFRKTARRWVGQIGAGGVSDNTTTTIPLASTTNLPTDTGVTVTIDRVDANGVATPLVEETVTGVVSGSNLVSCVRGVEGTAQAHDAGAVVEVLFSNAIWGDFITGIMVEHQQDGTHGTLSAPVFTSPSIITGINDVNNNELIKITATTSAVNEITLANGATGASPTITASGETNVGLDMKMKGTGKFRKPTVVGIQVLDAAVNTSTGDGKAFFRIPAELNGMNLTGVAATVYTAGTTNTTDVQIRNKTDSVDMLSTKITIDSGETDTATAATPAVIDTSKDDVVTGDILAIDVDAVSTTPAKGLYIECRFELP